MTGQLPRVARIDSSTRHPSLRSALLLRPHGILSACSGRQNQPHLHILTSAFARPTRNPLLDYEEMAHSPTNPHWIPRSVGQAREPKLKDNHSTASSNSSETLRRKVSSPSFHSRGNLPSRPPQL